MLIKVLRRTSPKSLSKVCVGGGQSLEENVPSKTLRIYRRERPAGGRRQKQAHYNPPTERAASWRSGFGFGVRERQRCTGPVRSPHVEQARVAGDSTVLCGIILTL